MSINNTYIDVWTQTLWAFSSSSRRITAFRGSDTSGKSIVLFAHRMAFAELPPSVDLHILVRKEGILFQVSLPPSSNPTYPGAAPMRREIVCRSWYYTKEAPGVKQPYDVFESRSLEHTSDILILMLQLTSVLTGNGIDIVSQPSLFIIEQESCEGL